MRNYEAKVVICQQSIFSLLHEIHNHNGVGVQIADTLFFILNLNNKANAKRGLACCLRDSYKQLAGNGFKFTDPCSLTMGSS